MTIEEQKRIAKDQGRLAAWRGQTHHNPSFFRDAELLAAWEEGVKEQCEVMSAEAAKIPLTWPDQMKSGARAD